MFQSKCFCIFAETIFDLTEIIFKAIVAGVVLSVLIGPVFFILLETSIRKGVKAALAFDAGVLLSDLIYICIAYFFYSEVESVTKSEDNFIIKIIGGSFFLFFGVATFLKKIKDPHADPDSSGLLTQGDYLKFFTKGFILNLVNPMVLFYWFSILALGSKGSINGLSSGATLFIYIAVLLFTFFSIDVLKIFGAKMLRPYITKDVLSSLNKITGSIIFIFGIILLVQVIFR